MALEALSSNDLFNFIIYDTISATPYSSHDSSENSAFLLENIAMTPQNQGGVLEKSTLPTPKRSSGRSEVVDRRQNLAVQAVRKKRRRKPRVCKNKEEAETQRMTHIAVERNRRKQMNEHLQVLRSLMPESYAQRVCLSCLILSLSLSQYLLRVEKLNRLNFHGEFCLTSSSAFIASSHAGKFGL
jgi:hypothetical protein